MRICSYNIWDGCKDDPKRLEALGTWVREQDFGLLGLCECNTWNESDRFRAIAAQWGFDHSLLCPTRYGYHLVLMAKQPIACLGLEHPEFFHGLLLARVGGLHIALTHLAPARPIYRRREASALVRRLNRITTPLLVLGDLNTISRRDMRYHGARSVNTWLGYDVMDTLHDAGFMDYLDTSTASHSVPTSIGNDFGHTPELRIDYILHRGFAEPHRPRVWVQRDERTAHLSDHYPVIAEDSALDGLVG